MSAKAIVVRDLTKRFPVRRQWAEMVRGPFRRGWTTVLDGVNLEIEQGEVFGLLGPNGAGKTTLLKILSTLLLPSEGQAFVDGHDVVSSPHRARQAVGYCLDSERSFYYRLSGIENLAFFATLNNLDTRNATRRIAEVLKIVDLNGAADVPFMTYSKGMQQKLGLARALLTDPLVLLLDEPTKSLDPGAAAGLRRFLRDTLAGRMGKTILLVTHSLEEARECCDRTAVIGQGKISFQGSWPEVQGFVQSHMFPGYFSAGVA